VQITTPLPFYCLTCRIFTPETNAILNLIGHFVFFLVVMINEAPSAIIYRPSTHIERLEIHNGDEIQ